MKTAFVIIGIILILAGAVWCLQGLSVLPGSVMSGQPRWIVFGGLAVIAGAILLILTARKKRPPAGGSV